MVILSYQDISSDQNNSIDVMLPQQKTVNKERCHASIFPFRLDFTKLTSLCIFILKI